MTPRVSHKEGTLRIEFVRDEVHTIDYIGWVVPDANVLGVTPCYEYGVTLLTVYLCKESTGTAYLATKVHRDRVWILRYQFGYGMMMRMIIMLIILLYTIIIIIMGNAVIIPQDDEEKQEDNTTWIDVVMFICPRPRRSLDILGICTGRVPNLVLIIVVQTSHWIFR